jgi:integrase
MHRTRLTPERIRRFSCPPGKLQAFLWDTEVPRLAVRATAGGAKSFIFEGKLSRQTIRRTLGDCSAWNLSTARAEASRLKVLVDQGIDPRELDRERVSQQAAEESARKEAQAYTLRALCDVYVRHLAARGKAKSAAATASAFRCHVYTRPQIADKPARAVTAPDIALLVRAVKEAGKARAAGILRSYLCATFNAARKAPLSADLPAELIPFRIEHNPVEAVPAMSVAARHRALSVEELRVYLAHLGDDVTDQALRLALLAGGQRMAQLLRAMPGDFEAESGTLRLLDPKGKRTTPREHLLPLGPKASALVAGLADYARSAGRPWLFSTNGKTALAETTPGKRVAEIAAAMGGEPFDLRDVRRTCETMLAALGISRDIRAQLLSHGLSGVQQAHYDRHDYLNEKHAALLAWEARLAEIASGSRVSNVVAL